MLSLQVSYPLSRCTSIHETGAYACLDYDSEEEFAQFFHQCRSELLQAFRQATLVAPLVTFAYVEEWLATRIQKSMTEQATECNYQSATYLEWEALSQVTLQHALHVCVQSYIQVQRIKKLLWAIKHGNVCTMFCSPHWFIALENVGYKAW
jgi:AraC-like DNA-binding protein